jgi:hypothetical protein
MKKKKTKPFWERAYKGHAVDDALLQWLDRR